MYLEFALLSVLTVSNLAEASSPPPPPSSVARPNSEDCQIKAEIKSIDSISEVAGAGATVEMTVDVKKSSCKSLIGEKRALFHWDPKGRFRHRLDVLKQTNAEISKVGVFRKGIVFEGVMDSYDNMLSELNGLKLPAPKPKN